MTEVGPVQLMRDMHHLVPEGGVRVEHQRHVIAVLHDEAGDRPEAVLVSSPTTMTW